MWEFWKTFITEKSEVTRQYINKKKEANVLARRPVTAILLKIIIEFLFFVETINCNAEKRKESQSAEFPKVDAMVIIWFSI